jgi:hypothetical protein
VMGASDAPRHRRPLEDAMHTVHDSAARFGRVVAAALLSFPVAACGNGSPLNGASDAADAAPFARREVTWAQGDRIHYGQRTFDLGSQQLVRELRPSAHGFFVLLVDRGDDTGDYTGGEGWHFFDGETLAPLGSDVGSVRVSPDGRYAGWVDRHGPLRPAGRIAKVVVVDVASGMVLLEDHSGMGGGFGDDLEARYGELAPTFLGFDDEYAYWTNAEGHGARMRWERSTGTVSTAENEDPDRGTRLLGRPYDAYAGEAVGLVDGKPEREGGVAGLVSPDGRFVAKTGITARLRFYDREGSPVPVDLGHRFAFLGGWLDGDRFFAVTRDRFEGGHDPAAPDASRGWLTTCSLRTGTCRDSEQWSTPGA